MKKTQKLTPRQVLEKIAKLKKTSSGGNEGAAIGIARDFLEIQGENFKEYDSRKPLGIDTLLEQEIGEKVAKKYLQYINDAIFGVEARLLPDDIETRAEYLENVKNMVKELAESLLKQPKAKPVNIGITLAAVGLGLITTSQNI